MEEGDSSGDNAKRGFPLFPGPRFCLLVSAVLLVSTLAALSCIHENQTECLYVEKVAG